MVYLSKNVEICRKNTEKGKNITIQGKSIEFFYLYYIICPQKKFIYIKTAKIAKKIESI